MSRATSHATRRTLAGRMGTFGSDSLHALSRPFRERYLTSPDVHAQLRSWAEAYPNLVRVRSIGTSLEGRELLLATIGPDPDRRRPSVWVDGNMHASELCGASVALSIAEDVLRLHLAPDGELHGLPAHVRARLREVLFYVLPSMCPDGADAVLRDGRYVRSNPRDRRAKSELPRWVGRDVDGDGLALLMRKRDDSGEFVESAEVPGLLLPRRIEDPGPYFKVYPEGVIDPWDGRTIPDPYFLSDNDTDLNRNFPWSWRPEPEQVGAGAYPLSEPESRAVVEFTSERPEIFAWLNLHTFGGVYIRPLGHGPDRKMDPSDLAVFRQVAEWGQEIGGYPTVSGFEEFLYEPEKPLHGDLADYAYHQRGALAYVCELWDLFAQLGIERKKPFVDHYAHLSRAELVKLGAWDRDHNESRIVRPWKRCAHPQLGDVEVGGVDPRVGMVNPSYEKLGEVCVRQSSAFLRVAAMAPAVRVAGASVTDVAPGVRRLEVTVENQGYLPSYGLASSKALPWNEPLVAEARCEGGCELVSPDDARSKVGHLDGWGRGLYGTDAALFHQRSSGSVSRARAQWVLRGAGVVTVSVRGNRVGEVTVRVEVGG